MMMCMRWSQRGNRFVLSCHLNYEAGHRFLCYLSRITGRDPLYGLSRSFLSRHCSVSPGVCFNYEFSLSSNGVYEFAVKTVNTATGKLIRRERKWLVLFCDQLYLYDEEEMDNAFILLTAFNLEAQSEEAAS